MGRLYHDETDSRSSRARRAWSRRRAWGIIVMLMLSLALLPSHARTAPPAQSDATPAPGVTVDLETLVDSLTWGKDLVQGSAPAGALIEVLLDEDVNATTLADATGQWRAAVLFATPGSHEFAVRVRNSAGELLGAFGPMTIIVPAHALGQAAAAETLTAPATVTATVTLTATAVPGWRTALGVVVNAVIQQPDATAMPEAATAVVTLPPTSTPTASPVPTATPVPPTVTPIPSATETAIATATATATARTASTATATPQPTMTFTATPLPAATSTSTSEARARPSSPRHHGQPSTPPAMAAVPAVNVRLLSPDDMESGYGRRTFAWEADYALPPGLAFELIFWHENRDPLATGFGLAPPTRATSLAVDLNQLDHDLGNLLQPGLYRWGVLLVQVAPYQRLAFLGDSHRFRFDRTYGHHIEPLQRKRGVNTGGNAASPPLVGLVGSVPPWCLRRNEVGDQINAELVVASHPHDLGVDRLGPGIEHARFAGGQSPRTDGRNRPVAAAALLAAG
ncbi:MAG: hypothetical protein KDD83_22630, partial [Caldilineaceae bacterium]|nr:hypothetical protein [Caldilineaceae bacterium]